MDRTKAHHDEGFSHPRQVLRILFFWWDVYLVVSLLLLPRSSALRAYRLHFSFDIRGYCGRSGRRDGLPPHPIDLPTFLVFLDYSPRLWRRYVQYFITIPVAFTRNQLRAPIGGLGGWPWSITASGNKPARCQYYQRLAG